jgi:Tyrosyl-DNA phosphodiesterase
MYIQDFSRVQGQQMLETMPQFAKDLIFFCEAQNFPSQAVQKLAQYDFSLASDVQFVFSIGGEHFGTAEDFSKLGRNGLARALHNLGFETNEKIELDYVVCVSSSETGFH